MRKENNTSSNVARAPQNGTGCTCHISPCVLLDWGESLAHRAQNVFSSLCQEVFSLCTAGSLHTAKSANKHQTDVMCIRGKSFCNFDRGFGIKGKAEEASLEVVVAPGVPDRCCWAAMRAFRRSIFGSSETALCEGWEGPRAENSGGSLDPRSDPMPMPSARMNCCCCASDHTEGSGGALLAMSFSSSTRCWPAEPDTDRG